MPKNSASAAEMHTCQTVLHGSRHRNSLFQRCPHKIHSGLGSHGRVGPPYLGPAPLVGHASSTSRGVNNSRLNRRTAIQSEDMSELSKTRFSEAQDQAQPPSDEPGTGTFATNPGALGQDHAVGHGGGRVIEKVDPRGQYRSLLRLRATRRSKLPRRRTPSSHDWPSAGVGRASLSVDT